MRPALAGAVGAQRTAAGGGASAPSTPTISAMSDTTNGQDADLRFTWSSNNGAALTSLDIRWATDAAMTVSLSAALNKTSGMFTYPGESLVALASASPGAHHFGTSSIVSPASTPADGVAAYYQIRLTNSAGTSAWSSAFGPVTTSSAG